MTNEEKEALFAEFEERLSKKKKKQGYASGYETMYNLKPGCDYFWKKYNDMTDSYEFDIWSPNGMVYGDWYLIRKLVCHAFGVYIVKDIPTEQLEYANNIAMRITDLLFEANKDILREKSLEKLKEEEA